MAVTRKYAAFISYNHEDVKVAKWLQRRLEAYKLPVEIHNEFDGSRYLRPVFRDRSDLNGGILTDEIREHLEQSKYLIVICSPNSAKSQWVSDEVRAFIQWGRIANIIPYIVDGTLYSDSDDECLPAYLKSYVKKNPDRELLCIDAREDGRHSAFIRVVSRVLGVSYDSLWHRYRRELIKNRTILTMAIAFASAVLYWFGTPVHLEVGFNDPECDLPAMRNAVLYVDGVESPILGSDTVVVRHLPGYKRGRSVEVSFSATYYVPLEKTLELGLGVRSNISLQLSRDNTFAVFAGTVLDHRLNPLKGAEVLVGEGEKCVTDTDGKFIITYPLDKQSLTKSVRISMPGFHDFFRDDESPSQNLIYTLKPF
jgi:hypothetical protein